ncbi:transcription factor ABA-INDUCIBLE bHLH-TYPE-like isoform X2 [Cryptomeria japonica]|uniref:transcription factor ABA-INDUCIBLE bHLH-TYPE-like isoform X2 n=1 Tax=Cryptomeria japonica TaxID=3369 RepID=UPI0027DA1CE5|nr:transcription factor ABA-INDUCIBLE bHLH-TYPE-like isoform X2 [Cryptomeria japonica]
MSRNPKSTDLLGALKQITETTNIERGTVAERLRRNRMKYFCAKLESLIPTTLPKDAGNYIKELQEQLSQLKRKRESLQEKLHEKTVKEKREVPRVDVEVKERETVIIISSIRRPRHFWTVIMEVEQHGLDVNMSQFSSSDFFVYLYFHASLREGMKDVDPAQLQNSLKTRLLAAY